MIKAVFFDFDGTLSNRQGNAYAIYRAYLENHLQDIDPLVFEGILQDLMTFDCNGIIDIEDRLIPFMKKYGHLLPADFAEKFAPYYNANMYRYTLLKKETPEVLEKLKGRYKLAIVSNGDSMQQHNKIDQVRIAEYFDLLLVGGDIGIQKPDKRIFEYAADHLKLELNECLMVGDVFANDIVGALKAGLKAVWICTDQERPSAYDGYRISDLRELLTILEKEDL